MTTDTAILEFDEKGSRAVEDLYGTPDVVEQRREVVAALSPRPGERVLDVGAGPGLLAADLAEAVGPTGVVHGVDSSASMIELARRRVLSRTAAPLELAPGDAAALPFPDATFDVVVSTQVLEYVADVDAALSEAHRVLRPGGRVLVLDTDWDSIVWRSSDDARMARVLAAWDGHLVHRDLPRRLPQLLRAAGFALAGSRVIPLLNVGYRRETYSGGMLELIADYVAAHGVDPAEARAWADDLRSLGEDGFFSISRFVFTAVR